MSTLERPVTEHPDPVVVETNDPVVVETHDPAIHPVEANTGRWSPAQLIAGAVGVFLAVLGGVALARTGFGELTSPETTVLGFGHTPLLGMIEIGLGLVLMINAASAFASRSILIGFGALAAAFGLIVVIEPGAFQDWLGVTRDSGWLYLGLGGAAFLLGLVSPVRARR
jgi:hypothetical protein